MKWQWKYLALPVLLLIGLAACTKSQSNMQGNTVNPPAKKYLALGDSYTIGQSVTVAENFPMQTKALLASQGIPVADPRIIAVTGWTTSELMEGIAAQKPQGPFDIVTLLIGVNDQYRHLDTAGYRIRFSQLLQQAITFAGNDPQRVIVLSIPDYSITPFAAASDTAAIRREIDAFNSINKEITLRQNCQYLDITPSTRDAAKDPSLLAPDGLHPSGKEYSKWAQWLVPLIRAVW